MVNRRTFLEKIATTCQSARTYVYLACKYHNALHEQDSEGSAKNSGVNIALSFLRAAKHIIIWRKCIIKSIQNVGLAGLTHFQMNE